MSGSGQSLTRSEPSPSSAGEQVLRLWQNTQHLLTLKCTLIKAAASLLQGHTPHPTPDKNHPQHSIHRNIFLRPAGYNILPSGHIFRTFQNIASNTRSSPHFSTVHKAVPPCRCNYTSPSRIVHAHRVCPLCLFVFLIWETKISEVSGCPELA